MAKPKRIIPITDANRFSTFVSSPNSPQYQCLLQWHEWFTQRGIISVIAATSSGYALYRKGLIPVQIRPEDYNVSSRRIREKENRSKMLRTLGR